MVTPICKWEFANEVAPHYVYSALQSYNKRSKIPFGHKRLQMNMNLIFMNWANCKGSFTNYVMHFSLLFDHPPTYGYVFAIILLNKYLKKISIVIS